jgi:hypothetical protein
MTMRAMGRTVWVLAVVVGLAGCETLYPRVDCAGGNYWGWTANEMFPRSPRLDCQFGDAVNTAVARQVLDKDAAARNAGKTAAGMDGASAKEIVDRYHKSYRAPEPNTSAFTIGVGSGSSGGMSSGQ